jgi:hypothetical protein
MRFEDADQAEMWREALENEGIIARVVDERVGGEEEEEEETSDLPRLGGWVKLQVRDEDAVMAGKYLEEGFDEVMGESSNPQVT